MRSYRAGKGQWTVYILNCRDGTLYTGVTNNLAERLKRHQAGIGARYTRGRLPVKVVYREPCLDRGSALKREWAVKRLARKEKLALIGRPKTLFGANHLP